MAANKGRKGSGGFELGDDISSIPQIPTAVPPRSAAGNIRGRSHTIAKNMDSRQLLIGMGFPKNRAEKALAATGDRGVQTAADWLLAHVFDPELDQTHPREFVIYACPKGTLGRQVEEYMETSLLRCGRNGVHKSFPHVTLCQFFKADDAVVPHIVHSLRICIDLCLSSAPMNINLRRFVAQSYMGLFLEEEAASWFRKLAKNCAADIRKHNVSVEPHRRQLHVTLAHQYLPEHHSTLDELSRSMIDPQAPSRWELQLYSRDHRLSSSEVYKVLFPYTPQKDDELELQDGDFVYVSTSDQGQTDHEGWFYGTSYKTGTSGLYPGNYVEKAKDSDCWTLHRSWTISGTESNPSPSEPSIPRNSSLTRRNSFRHEEESSYDDSAGLLPKKANIEELYARVQRHKKIGKEQSSPPAAVLNGTLKGDDLPPPIPSQDLGPRRIFIFRHAERVDVTFGKQWIQLSFDTDGSYHRRNLNMPKEIPKRKGGPSEFLKDSPITEGGLFQARLTGEGMREQGIRITRIYCSPALRCVQTATGIIQGLQDPSLKIKVENGLFEWLAWCRGGFPTFITPQELSKCGMMIDSTYLSQVALQDLKHNETHLEFYKRMYNITRLILKTVGVGSGNIMFVGHAATLEACTRQLIGATPRSAQELTKIVQKIPYCGLCVCQESEFGKNSTWDYIDPPIPPLTHAPNIRFDWRSLQ